MYYAIRYKNFEEFKEAHPALAEELVNEVSEGAWQNEELCWYETLSDLAEYEMEDGWYFSCNIIDQDFGCMPNPLDHIDLNGLGEALSEKWDEGIYHRLSDDSVITTNCRWES